MANYSSLIGAINAAIKQNGNQEITGPVLNSVLNAMVSSLGNGWQFGGVVTPASNPGSPDAKLFYLAWTPGTYTGFGNKVLEENKLGIFTKTGSTVTLDTVNLGGGTSPSRPGTYVVTDLELLDDSAASAQIDTAIGGFDNLVAAIQSGAVVLSADTTNYQHAYKIAVAELGDTDEGLASITILDTSKLNLERYTISKSSSGELSLKLFTISAEPINSVYTVRMKGLKNTSNSNEIIAAIGSWPQLFSALSDNKIIMEVPTENEPYGSLYICYIVTGTSTTGVIQLSTLDSSSGNYVLKTYTISAASAAQLSVTVDLALYLKKTDAEATYQKITDSTLATNAKTVVGAINEVNKKVSEIPESETYKITLLSSVMTSDKRPDELTSEEIDAAIGGWDNFKAAVLEGKSIKEIVNYSSGDATLQINVSYEASIDTVSSDDIEGIVLSISRLEHYLLGNYTTINIQILNNNGVLTLRYLVKEVFIEGEEYYDLQTTDKTIIGAINELKSSADTNTNNVTRIDRAVGNPTVTEHNFTVAESGKIWISAGQKVSSSNWFISEIINISKGDAISFKTSGTSGDISAITKVSASGEFINAVVPMNADMDSVYWVADEDSHIQVTIPLRLKDNPYTIIKSPFNTAVSDNSYMQYLHKVYEEYGAVYNAETGYPELNGLTDLTEEDMYDIWLWTHNIINQPDLAQDLHEAPIRTTFPHPSCSMYRQGPGTSLNQAVYNCKFLEIFHVTSLPDGSIKITDSLSNACHNAFNNCLELREITDILDVSVNTPGLLSAAFNLCAKLSKVRIKGLRQEVSFKYSPLLSYESLNYIVTSAANTSAITITVHPTTYSYLTGTAQPTAEVGGTSEEWQALVTTAQGKQISFAQPAETLEVEPLE